MGNAKDVASAAKDAAASGTDAAVDAAASIPDVSYDDISKQIAGIGEMAKDGLDDSEMEAISGL